MVPLWRFFAIAAILVAAAGSLLFAHRGGPPDLRISGPASGTPTAERPPAAATPLSRAAFAGSGPWVMSSLPACFAERERIRGRLDALRAKFPPTSERVRPPSVVLSGECTIFVRGDELWITRGADRLRVPPQAFLYRNARGLTLVYVHAGEAEIRRY